MSVIFVHQHSFFSIVRLENPSPFCQAWKCVRVPDFKSCDCGRGKVTCRDG